MWHLPSHAAKQKSLAVHLVFRATLIEVEKADSRISCPILGKAKPAHWHSRIWRLFLEGDEI